MKKKYWMVYNQTIKNTMIEKNIKIIIMKGYEKKHSPIYIYIKPWFHYKNWNFKGIQKTIQVILYSIYLNGSKCEK